jgi:alpha-N-arabinofuranosidase
MRVAVGPSDDDASYTEAVMKAWSERDWSWSVEGLSLHSYTVPKWPPSLPSVGFGEGDYAQILKTTLTMDQRIARHSAIMDKYDPKKEVALVVDEWGVWLKEDPGTAEGFLQQQNSMRDAVLAALNFNIFARHADRVRAANIAQMVNVLQAVLLTKGPQMVRTPTYWVHQMYVPMQDATFVPVEFERGEYRYGDIDLPGSDAVAFRDKAGRLHVALVNLDPHKGKTMELTAPTKRFGTAAGTVLTAPAVNSINTFDKPDTVVPKPIEARVRGGRVTVEMPPMAIAVLDLG